MRFNIIGPKMNLQEHDFCYFHCKHFWNTISTIKWKSNGIHVRQSRLIPFISSGKVVIIWYARPPVPELTWYFLYLRNYLRYWHTQINGDTIYSLHRIPISTSYLFYKLLLRSKDGITVICKCCRAKYVLAIRSSSWFERDSIILYTVQYTKMCLAQYQLPSDDNTPPTEIADKRLYMQEVFRPQNDSRKILLQLGM